MSLQRCYELFKICCTWKKECHDPDTEGYCPCQVPGFGWWPGSLSQPLWPSPPACCSWWSVPTSPASTPRSHPGIPQSAWSWYGVYMFSILPTTRTIMALNWWKQGHLIHRHYMPRIFFSYWRQQLRSVSVSRLFICFSFFFSLLSSATAFMFPRQPSPTGYHNTYQLYTMENTRQTILNDYITSQQMHVIPRPDMARGLSPREQPVTIPYAAGARGTALWQLTLSHLLQQEGGEAAGERGYSI